MEWKEFKKNVQNWSLDRGIYQYSTARAQLLKAVAEFGELCDAEAKNDQNGKVDGVGDLLVTLVNYCAMAHIDIDAAMDVAWKEIKDRKGRMIAGGVFVKD